MAFKVVNVTPIGETEYAAEVLGKVGAEYIESWCNSEDEVINLARDADGVIVVLTPFPRNIIDALTKCRVIAAMSTGYDNIDIDAATEHGICVCNVPDYCLDEMSDNAMALLLACARKIVLINNAIRKGETAGAGYGAAPMFRLRGQTLGLVGFGRIPRTMVRKAQGFGLNIIAYDPYVHPATVEGYDIELVKELDELLERSDFVSVHAALTKENRNMFGLEQFKKMKPTAYFINTARGGLVNEEALYTALTEGNIAGAALDVIEPELNLECPLLKLDNLIYTGHSGYYSETSRVELRHRPPEYVAALLEGKWPYGCVNPQVKEKFTQKWGNLI
jgi:D-3-phosphoglycerate dehydrogenase